MRKLLNKYNNDEWISFYNSYVQEHLMKKLDAQPFIHICAFLIAEGELIMVQDIVS